MIAKYIFLALILIGVMMLVQDRNLAWGLGLIGLVVIYSLEFSSPT